MSSVSKGPPKIQIQQAKIDTFCKTHHITHLALFGSVLTDGFSEVSDVDILVEFDKAHIPGFFGLIEMEDELARIVGRKARTSYSSRFESLFS